MIYVKIVGADTIPLRLTQGGMMYRGAKLWNLLDQDLKNESSLLQFNRKVKKLISEKIPVKPP